MQPILISENIYDESTWSRRYEVRTNYVDDANPGDPVDLRPYIIKMQGRKSSFTRTYFDLVKLKDQVSGTGITINGDNFNELLIELSSNITKSFRGITIIADLQMLLDGNVQFWIRWNLINQSGMTR
jgi:hypothetical protein